MSKLTQNEITAMKTCLNYDDRETQLCDNFSNGGADEFKAVLGWTDAQVRGLISSLEQKGMGNGDYADAEGSSHTFWLSEKGVNAIFDVIEAEKELVS